MDISDFYQTFFDEADELLANMEQHLLDLLPEDPDPEQLNAIFRAAHSIKGGAATFGFTVLQETTHLMENLLDEARRGEMRLNTSIINLFLETKDIMQEQLDAYKSSEEPDAASFEYICQALRQLALEAKQQDGGAAPAADQPVASAETVPSSAVPSSVAASSAPPSPATSPPVAAPPVAASSAVPSVRIVLSKLKAGESDLLLGELKNLGQVSQVDKQADSLAATLTGNIEEQDIVAVLCFVIEAEQIAFYPAENAPSESASPENASAPAASGQTAPPAETKDSASHTSSSASSQKAEHAADHPGGKAAEKDAPHSAAREHKPGKERENTSIRVAVEKVDQLINQVGELVITQSMLQQLSGALDPVAHGDLLSSMSQLQRNARDLQESVMSIRMMPMEYVFSRFPRLVRDLAGKLGKQVELTLQGSSTELDKSLIERIIDPLTHLVRNSLDHGIEMPEERVRAGKTPVGNLVLSAEHQGGNICIEVTDDGAGLNRERIIEKAISRGMAISESMPDEEVWMLIFAPGFSTAEKVTDVSGRGVGMDVVKRNIQQMGGHVEIQSKPGKGARIRILLPLTLAILDGMSVKVSNEVFILPLNAVMESLQPRSEDLHPLTGGEHMLEVRGEYLPLVELWKVFAVQGAKTESTQGIVVILQGAGYRYALQVDQLIGQHQVVVKNLESNYRKVPGISAATILGDGSVALIVDVASLPELNRQQQNTVRGLSQTAA